MKRTVPVFIATAAGFVLIAARFVPYTKDWGDKVAIWFDVVSAIAILLGAANLLGANMEKIVVRQRGWGFAVVTIVAFFVTLFVGLAKVGVFPNEKYPDYAWSGDFVQEGSAFWWLYEYTFVPMQSTMFAMLAFFMATAAFRAFRAKNVEAAMLLGTALIVLIGRTYAAVPLTGWLPASLRFDRLTGEVIMSILNLAGMRAITIGIALGVVATSLKILLGVDRPYLGSDRE